MISLALTKLFFSATAMFADFGACNAGAGLVPKLDKSGKAIGCEPATGHTAVGIIHNVVNILTFIIGVASVIMIIVGGLQYVLSGGDSGATKNAKNTILYAVIGVILSLLAYAIVGFVINRLT